ncbi:hypothetical protein FCJ61_07640 [Burkholderia metallica]|nr:hypothetical protein [Burkholderia metallica]
MIERIDVYYDGWGEHWLWGSLTRLIMLRVKFTRNIGVFAGRAVPGVWLAARRLQANERRLAQEHARQ